MWWTDGMNWGILAAFRARGLSVIPDDLGGSGGGLFFIIIIRCCREPEVRWFGCINELGARFDPIPRYQWGYKSSSWWFFLIVSASQSRHSFRYIWLCCRRTLRHLEGRCGFEWFSWSLHLRPVCWVSFDSWPYPLEQFWLKSFRYRAVGVNSSVNMYHSSLSIPEEQWISQSSDAGVVPQAVRWFVRNRRVAGYNVMSSLVRINPKMLFCDEKGDFPFEESCRCRGSLRPSCLKFFMVRFEEQGSCQK